VLEDQWPSIIILAVGTSARKRAMAVLDQMYLFPTPIGPCF
jgi:hypothetical protein